MKLFSRFATVFAFLLFAAAPVRAVDPIEIKQQWLAGKKYYQTLRTEQRSTFQVGPQKMDQSSTMTVDLTMTVGPKKAGEPKRMTIRYERTAMEINMNGQRMGFDSADPNPGNDPLGLAKTAGATVGKELKVILNDHDQVAEIENYDEFIKNLAPSAMPGFDPSKMFSRDALSQMLQQGSLQALPNKPVAVGETWPFQTDIALPQLGTVGMKGNYTLKAIGDHRGTNCAEIATDGTLSMDLAAASTGAEKGSPLATLGMKVTDGTLKGSIWFDPQLGFARESQLVQEMKISMKNPTDPTATIDVPMKQTIHMELTKVEAAK